MVKEVERQRMEEVDLDTGRRRSWIQTKEVEIFDLTGDTPAKPARSPMAEKSNNIVMNLARELKVPKDGGIHWKAPRLVQRNRYRL